MLILSTVALYALTSFLFRSFSARRVALGQEFATSGQHALSSGEAEQAVHDLRISLSYAPDEMGNRLLLAEALAQANHPDQARGYFLGLLDEQPADGFLNLQLARLARKRKDTQAAVSYYRAAGVGNWSGASLDQRFHVQLELAEYLIQLGNLPPARAELLVAAADSPEDAMVQTALGEEFERAGDPTDALSFYQRAIKMNPDAAAAIYKAGRVSYETGDYVTAARLLALARRTDLRAKLGDQDAQEAERLLDSSQRIEELTLSSTLPSHDRIEHLLRAIPIARARFESCSAQFNGGQPPGKLQSLQAGWDDADRIRVTRSALDDASQQENLTRLIFETEQVTSEVCGAPSGDDALLLQLANSSSEDR